MICDKIVGLVKKFGGEEEDDDFWIENIRSVVSRHMIAMLFPSRSFICFRV
jgi:hypothetical protein